MKIISFLAVYCAGAVLSSVIPYAAFVRFDVKKPFTMLQIKKVCFIF